jgi:hypothetical protein
LNQPEFVKGGPAARSAGPPQCQQLAGAPDQYCSRLSFYLTHNVPLVLEHCYLKILCRRKTTPSRNAH